MSKFNRALLWIASAASVLSLSLVIWSVIYLALLSKSDKTWHQVVDEELQTLHTPPAVKNTPPPTPLTADEKFELQQSVAGTRSLLIAEIHAADADERAILDRLITLVGVFSAILGLLAFATVKLAREDAREQSKRIESDLTAFRDDANIRLGTFKTGVEGDLSTFKTKIENDLTVFKTTTTGELETFKNKTIAETSEMKTTTELGLKNALETNRLGLESLTRATTFQIEEFQRKIWSELPEMRNMKESLRDLLYELERTIPTESNWNSERSYESLNESERQTVLITESTVNALRLFISKSSTANLTTLARLYRALAGFYLGRFRVDKANADVDRAEVYVLSSQQIEPENPDNDRLRGALYLAKYRILKQRAPEPHSTELQLQLKQALEDAERFLKDARRKNGNDAGAAYNLALVASYRLDFDDAIAISKQVIQQAITGKLTPEHVHKYLPNVYVNLCCYLARKADAETEAGLKKARREETVQVVKDGIAYFDNSEVKTGKSVIQTGMRAERADSAGALRNLASEQKAAIDAML